MAGRLRTGIAWTTLWVIVILGLIVIIKPSAAFKGCIHSHKNSAQHQELYKNDTVLINRLMRFYVRSRLVGVCVAHFADENERAIGAFSAVALALFTLYLWRATQGLRRYAGIQARDMQDLLRAAQTNASAAGAQAEAAIAQEKATSAIAKATQESTHAMIAIEEPVFAWGGAKLVRYAGQDGPSTKDPVPGGIPDGFNRPLVSVTNAGRSPMVIQDLCIEYCVCKALPERPIYKNIGRLDRLIERETSIWLFNAEIGFELSRWEADDIRNNIMYLWIFGYVSDYNRFRRETIDHGFVARWNTADPNGFQMLGMSEYAYERIRRTKE